MKIHSDYIPLTQAQIAAAQHTDIAEYLQSRGEKLKRDCAKFRWKAPDRYVST